jgi:hypothetical protein
MVPLFVMPCLRWLPSPVGRLKAVSDRLSAVHSLSLACAKPAAAAAVVTTAEAATASEFDASAPEQTESVRAEVA